MNAKLTIKQAKSIHTVLKRIDPDARIIADYSGKFMFGKTCLGYVVSDPATVGMAVAMTLAGTKIDPLEMMSTSAMDDMGLNYIVYFPDYSVGTKS